MRHPSTRALRLLTLLALAAALATACVSPEASRTRGGGAGADPGNWRGPASVDLHPAGQGPFEQTPRIKPPGISR